MNFRNRKLVITVRVLFGLFMIMSGVGGLMTGASMENVPAPMLAMTQTLWATGIFQMIKVTEIIAGLMLVTGFLPALAAIFIAPIGIGVVIVNSRVAPDFVFMGVLVCLLDAYLGYAYWDKYKALFERN